MRKIGKCARERDAGHTYLTADGVDEDPESPMNKLLGCSITYRIAVGPQQDRKVMKCIVREKSNSDFEVIDEGTHVGICIGVIDIGTQETRYGPKVQAILQFEIPEDRVQYVKEGEEFDVPRTISKLYNKTLTKGSILRKDLESWRGKEFTSEEAAEFDLFVLVGKPCLLTVVHTNANDRVYANITGISKIMKGQVIPAQELKPIRFSPEYPDQYDDLPMWLRDKFDKRIVSNETTEENSDKGFIESSEEAA